MSGNQAFLARFQNKMSTYTKDGQVADTYADPSGPERALRRRGRDGEPREDARRPVVPMQEPRHGSGRFDAGGGGGGGGSNGGLAPQVRVSNGGDAATARAAAARRRRQQQQQGDDHDDAGAGGGRPRRSEARDELAAERRAKYGDDASAFSVGTSVRHGGGGGHSLGVGDGGVYYDSSDSPRAGATTDAAESAESDYDRYDAEVRGGLAHSEHAAGGRGGGYGDGDDDDEDDDDDDEEDADPYAPIVEAESKAGARGTRGARAGGKASGSGAASAGGSRKARPGLGDLQSMMANVPPPAKLPSASGGRGGGGAVPAAAPPGGPTGREARAHSPIDSTPYRASGAGGGGVGGGRGGARGNSAGRGAGRGRGSGSGGGRAAAAQRRTVRGVSDGSTGSPRGGGVPIGAAASRRGGPPGGGVGGRGGGGAAARGRGTHGNGSLPHIDTDVSGDAGGGGDSYGGMGSPPREYGDMSDMGGAAALGDDSAYGDVDVQLEDGPGRGGRGVGGGRGGGGGGGRGRTRSGGRGVAPPHVPHAPGHGHGHVPTHPHDHAHAHGHPHGHPHPHDAVDAAGYPMHMGGGPGLGVGVGGGYAAGGVMPSPGYSAVGGPPSTFVGPGGVEYHVDPVTGEAVPTQARRPAQPRSHVPRQRRAASGGPHRSGGGSGSGATSGGPGGGDGKRASSSEGPFRQLSHQQKESFAYANPDASREAINEKRIKSEDEKLYYSRHGRAVQYKPKTLKEYQKHAPREYYQLGTLGSDLNTDELVAKRANRERVKEFARQLNSVNSEHLKRATKAPPPPEKQDYRPAEPSARDKAVEYSKNVQRKVPVPQKPREPRGAKGGVDDYGSDGGGGGGGGGGRRRAAPEKLTRVEKLEAEHHKSRADVDAIRREFGL